ncbi:hypothetical protein QX249_11335 [Vibrio parahaemolyticus]|uniref:Uncharacterized protein n=1 Tax=Vibrio parahaemolyticus TaxID=670 RepID=A0AAW8PZ73_VIBPH|nr:hypothetical protein [Vibrio parahaemolyticus]EGR2227208.1 hypothetical protein [Vibrio parahaemolyticus]ELP5902542.1 hypothetical protein [Vibrio vulnificus]MDS1821257.1 hypothetical protein [Vibrio parahaemolyticus]
MRKFTYTNWAWVFAAIVAAIFAIYIIGAAISLVFWVAAAFIAAKVTTYVRKKKKNETGKLL